MELKNVIFSIVLGSLAIALISGVIISFGVSYELDYSDAQNNFSGSLNQMQEIQDRINDSNQALRSPTISPSTAINSMATGAWNVLLLVLGSTSMINDMLLAIANVLMIPEWVVSVIVGLIGTAIIFAIIAAIFNRGSI